MPKKILTKIEEKSYSKLALKPIFRLMSSRYPKIRFQLFVYVLMILFYFSGVRLNCDICETSFINQDEKLIHECSHSTTDELDLKFQSVVDVSPIDEEIKSHSCSDCNKIFVTFKALDKHINHIHHSS